MCKDGKEKYQRGKDRDEKSKVDNYNEEKGRSNNVGDGKDNDEKEDGARSHRLVIKSYPTRATRIALRGTKSRHIESRPPWNTGSTSPTATKAPSAQANLSIRALPIKPQNRQKAHGLAEPLSSPSLKRGHQVAASKSEASPRAPSPEPTNSIIPPKDPKTGLEWGYKQLDEFLQHATRTAVSPRAKCRSAATSTTQSSSSQKDRPVDQMPREVGSRESRCSAGVAATKFASSSGTSKDAINVPQSLREQTKEESFLESELTTSPRLKIPVSSPAMATLQFSPHNTTQISTTSSSKTNEQLSLEDELASERRRAYILAVLAQGENKMRPLTLTDEERPDPMYQLNQESDGEYAASRMTQPIPIAPKAQSPTSRQWPISQLQFDPEKSDEESASPQPARNLPSMIKVPCTGSRKLPMPQLKLDLEPAYKGQTTLQRATCPHRQTELDQTSLTKEKPSAQEVEPTQLVPRTPHPTPSPSMSTWTQIMRNDSPFYAGGESSGEDYSLKWRSVINRSRRLRQSRSQSSIKSVKWDPAIISCGPVTSARKTTQPKTNALSELSQAESEKSKMEENLEVFRKTVCQWKKGDRKAIRKFLEALKNLDSDEESFTKPKQTPKRDTKPSKTFSNITPGSRLNPLAPAFREPSQKATDDRQRGTSFLSMRQKRPHSLSNNREELVDTKETVQTCKPKPCTIRSCHGPRVPDVRKQESIWFNTFQPTPTIIPDQEDEDFQEFCRANNFIPIVPVIPNPIIPIAPPDPIVPFLPPYLDLELDPVSLTYTLPLDDIQPNLPAVPTHLVQLAGKGSGATLTKAAPITHQYYEPTADQEFDFTLEETSEPVEDEGWREAKALDPVWGAQILEHFLKKYPMTGRREPANQVSEENKNRKSAEKSQQEPRLKMEGKAAGVKATIKHAAEIQQKLEMILLQQRERKAPIVPAHKIRATEIQQKLEIMLYKLKEQKALERFSKRVPKRAETEKSFEKSFEKDEHSSRSTSKSSKDTVEDIEKLR